MAVCCVDDVVRCKWGREEKGKEERERKREKTKIDY